ncbi:unnamed protein product [Symbiodinium natans]|uniref:Sulfotransferase n=1 Tax=Symbiodinium natans TaxID=878477 RepID=A0A812Q294_9DINO|nr:unnamed protein product [Symbiodinium natans]
MPIACARRCFFAWILFCLAGADSDLCLVQLQTALTSSGEPEVEPIPGPPVWENGIHYLAVAYHKSGVDLMKGLLQDIFHALGAPDEALGRWIRPCYPLSCANFAAPARVLLDMYTPALEAEERAAAPQGMRVAGSVRDPLDMVASAYCYHVRGREILNVMALTPLVMFMDVQAGVDFLAGRMLQLVEDMAAVFAAPANDTHRVDYERMTGSSVGFDVELDKLLTFWFEDRLTDAEWAAALSAGRRQDLHRHPPKDHRGLLHTNSPDCMAQARLATRSIPEDLRSRYQALRRRLGYSTG